MSDNKKDLTRIEDLGEYLHELGQEEENQPSSGSPDLPDIPTEETDFSSESFNVEETTFNSEPTFETSEDSVVTSEETPFTIDEPTFETAEEVTDFGGTEFTSNEFGSTDFGTTEETPAEVVEDLFPAIDETPSFTPSEPVPELISEPEPQSVIPSEPTPTRVLEQSYKAPENFEDLKKFAENSGIAGMGAEGNPSFSILLKNVRYIEDVNDILALMKELGLLSDSEDQVKQRLMRGHLLVPRISEYSAIFLAHKLRRFDIDIQVGLSDEIHPPKHQESPEIGLVSKHSLYQNQTHHFHFDDPKLEISQIIIAATQNLEGHQVIKYLGVASEHKMLEGHIVEDEGSDEIPRHYSELAQKLKAHAMKAHANAVIGLNYQLTPLPSEYGISGSKYRLSCTGNLVWVNKL